ncbi:hypothetical protein ACRQ5Q_14790 [Bradyrhizobium sp. PMVTL-01]|uniref:hypothetical protein n=1 Tax=Bradyrhizobium sp. PMVTL-01 TaxID=3434999 RepID=UPI003F710085
MSRQQERRWAVYKDYYTEAGEACVDTWVVIYGTEAEANEAKARLEAGQDPSWFDPGDEIAAPILYVDEIIVTVSQTA